MRTTFTRRQWIKTTGAATLALPAFASADQELKSKAHRNLPLAIFTGTYSQFPLQEAAQKMRRDGFKGVVLQYAFADIQFDPLAPDWDKLSKIVSTLHSHDLEIAALYGYYNVVDPDPVRRKHGEDRMHCLITNWKRFGCRNISTETGTLNAQSEWAEAPENATEQGYQTCRAAFEKLARTAYKAGAIISVEGYWRNIISTATSAERLLHDVKSSALKIVMDPTNYYRREDLPQMDALLHDMFHRLGRDIVIAHAKDVKAAAQGTDLPAAGLGVLDYPLYLKLLA
ncbi:MAG: sugar phosphate isomerase/epimerase family protein, partial [Limisphaerales bacterium]